MKAFMLRLLLAAAAIAQQNEIPATESVSSLRVRAEKGEGFAQYLLGLKYNYGNGVPQDYAEAARWYRLAADHGGSAVAKFLLGMMYDSGQGVPQDLAEAARWYLKAAEEGHVGSQAHLGYIYFHGRGVPQNYTEAVRWWRKAADQGEYEAQYNVGVVYYSGRGVPQDYSEAHMWFNLAASHASGDELKKYADARELTAKQMTAQQIADAQRRAREWKPKVAENKGAGAVK